MIENFLNSELYNFCITIIQCLVLIVIILLSVAYLVYFERKVLGAMQSRKGPNVVGPIGLLQPIADAIKILAKEIIMPKEADKVIFVIAPMITLCLALIGWAVIPFDYNVVLADINLGLLYILSVSALGVYGVMMAGWASNSQYAFLGSMRSAAQMISYELAMSTSIIPVVMSAGSLNLSNIVLAQTDLWYVVYHFPVAIIFFISAIAETNRHPFDLPESEAELVTGYNVEYSSVFFVMFFLGEYANMILMSAITTILFLGGWLPIHSSLSFIPGFIWFILKVIFLLYVYVWLRAALPRYRYDQLMHLGWKVFLPFAFLWVILVSFFEYFK